MEVESARMIMEGMRCLAVALALLPLLGVGLAVGKIFVELISAVGKNPSAKDKVFPIGIIGFAVTEAIAIFALVVALVIYFVR